MSLSLPLANEPIEFKQTLNDGSSAVREAVLRQASDLASPIYGEWKQQLASAGVSWQMFQSASSANRDAWREWLNGETTWRDALVRLVGQVIEKAPDASLVVTS